MVIAVVNCLGEEAIEIKKYPLAERYFSPVPEDTIEWFEDEGKITTAGVYGFTVEPIGIFEAKTNQYDGLPSCDPLEQKLKKRIAEIGGNAWIYVGGVQKKNTERCVSISYKAFRVEWKGNPSIPARSYINNLRALYNHPIRKDWKERAEKMKTIEATEAFKKDPHYLKRQEIEAKLVVQWIRECFGIEMSTADINGEADENIFFDAAFNKPLQEFTESQRKSIQNCFGIKGEGGKIKDIIANLPDQEKQKSEQAVDRWFRAKGLKQAQTEFRKLAKAYPREYGEFRELYRKSGILLLSPENDDLRDITKQKMDSNSAALGPPKKTPRENKKSNTQTTVSDPFSVSGVSEVTLKAEAFDREKIESLIKLWQKKKMLDKETAKYIRVSWLKREKIHLKRTVDGKIIPGLGQKP